MVEISSCDKMAIMWGGSDKRSGSGRSFKLNIESNEIKKIKMQAGWDDLDEQSLDCQRCDESSVQFTQIS